MKRGRLAPDERVLIIDDEEQLGEPVASFLRDWGNDPARLTRPDDGELRPLLLTGATPDVVAIVSRDDIVALRYALLVEHLRPGIRLIVTIFDRTTAGEVARSVPNCTVLGMTDAIVPSLLAACVDEELSSIVRVDGRLVAATKDGSITPARVPVNHNRCPRGLLGRYRALDTSSRALVLSFAALFTILGLEALLGGLVFHDRWYDAIWQSTRGLTTVGSAPRAEHGPAWYKLLSTGLMLAALAMVGLFTASLVDRTTGRRLTGILGSRAVPAREHVIVVGLGQVGLRLCVELRELGIPVVVIERDEEARCLPLAQQRRIPVILGRGGNRFLLERAGLHHARALAAVSSGGLENISVAVTARAVAPHQRIVLRAGGSDDITDESRSLFRIGAVCDTARIIGALVACHIAGEAPVNVFLIGARTYALFPGGRVMNLAAWSDTAMG